VTDHCETPAAATAAVRSGDMDPVEPPMRQLIIESADRCFRRFGVDKTTIEDIADEVGVSRATIYRYIEGGREEIVLAVLVEESRRQVVELIKRFDDLDRLAEFMTAIMVELVFTNRENEGLATLFTPGSLGVGSALPGAADLLLDGTLDLFGPFLEAARAAGELRHDLTDREVAEYLLRIVMSLLSFEGPAGATRPSVRRFLETLVMPTLAP
jgi:AcrR family transcriptional regulator